MKNLLSLFGASLLFQWLWSPQANGQQSSSSAPFVFFAQCGDLDQMFDPAVGSPDRRSSYPGTWCALDVPDGKQTWDMDIPAPEVKTKVEFRLSGYPAFDPDSVEYAVLRIDVLYEPLSQHANPSESDSISFASHESCLGLCNLDYIKGLREALMKAGRDERQWISLTLDLVSGIVDAVEIDGRGNPLPGRFCPNISVEPNADIFLRFPAKDCRQILEEASDGTLQGSQQWSGKVSYVSLMGRARKPSSTKVLSVRAVENEVGTSLVGGFPDLRVADGSNWKIRPKTIENVQVAEFVAVFDAPEAVRVAAESAAFDAVVELSASAIVSVPGRFVLSIIDPAKQVRGNEVKIADELLSTSGLNETKIRRELKDIRRYVDEKGHLRIKFAYRNDLKNIPVINLIERINPSSSAAVQLDRLRVIVRVPG